MRVINPLILTDCFSILSHVRKSFAVSAHDHREMELNLIVNGGGAKRIVGNHTGEIEDLELVLIGSNLPHGWLKHHCKSKEVKEIALHFHKDLFEGQFLKRNQLSDIKKLLDESKKGIIFSRETTASVAPKLQELSALSGFMAVLEFMSILQELAIAKGSKFALDTDLRKDGRNDSIERIEKVYDYMDNHFHEQITLKEVAEIAGMPEASFSRYIKHLTGYTFIDSLNEIRLGHVMRMLISADRPIAEVADLCGFNNMANFNRTFKSKIGCTPKAYKDSYPGQSSFF